MTIKQVLVIFVLLNIGASCSDDQEDIQLPKGDYANGILIANEGPFENGSGTISFIPHDATTVTQDVYATVNGEDLGNIVQSVTFTNEKAFIIANVSNKITVVDRYTFVKQASITAGLHNPRYMAIANGKGYVSNWGDPVDEADDYIAIVDLETNTIEGTIAVVLGPEAILATGDKVFVAHQGAYGFNNKVSVIDTKIQEVKNVLTVGDVPNTMKLDDSGNLWVLSSGKPSYSGEETGGSLVMLNVETEEIISTLNFAITEHPGKLNYDSNTLYYALSGGIYAINVAATLLPATPVLEDVYPYAMAIKEGKLYTTDANDYASDGSLTIYNLTTKTALNSYTVGIIPGGIYFN